MKLKYIITRYVTYIHINMSPKFAFDLRIMCINFVCTMLFN